MLDKAIGVRSREIELIKAPANLTARSPLTSTARIVDWLRLGGRRIFGRRVGCAILLEQAQARQILLVLIVALREQVAAGAVGDKIEVLGTRGIGDGIERSAARIGDRTRRQAVDHIGVVGRRLLDLALQDRATERALAAGQSVNDGRVRLQPHLVLQAIDEDGGDTRPLLRLARLFFDDRGEDDELLRRLERQVEHTVLPNLRQQTPLRLLHPLDDLLARHTAGKFVGLRQQRALARNFLDLARELVVLQETSDDLLGRQPLRDGHGVLYHLVFNDDVDNVGKTGVLAELIFAGFKILARLERQHAADEYPRLIDHPFARQEIGDVAHAETVRDIDHLILR